ncbi:prepilin peptidase [Mycoplasmatota bacterium WC30]
MVIVYIIILFFLGATLSSFFFLVGERIPQQIAITGRSVCNHCKKKLRFVDEFPILGFLINLGKCHHCKKPINIQYLLYELLGGILFVFAYLMLGLDLELIIALTLISVFLVEIVSDVLYQIVIDKIWIIGAVIVFIIRIIQGNILDYILSATIMFSVMFLIGYIGKKIAKKDALGGGDIKLYFFIGLTITIWNSLLSLFLASVVALIFALIRKGSKKRYIPLVPFIFIGVLVTYFFGDVIINWYLNLIGM